MTKAKFIETVTVKVRLLKKIAAYASRVFIDLLREALNAKDKIAIPCF